MTTAATTSTDHFEVQLFQRAYGIILNPCFSMCLQVVVPFTSSPSQSTSLECLPLISNNTGHCILAAAISPRVTRVTAEIAPAPYQYPVFLYPSINMLTRPVSKHRRPHDPCPTQWQLPVWSSQSTLLLHIACVSAPFEKTMAGNRGATAIVIGLSVPWPAVPHAHIFGDGRTSYRTTRHTIDVKSGTPGDQRDLLKAIYYLFATSLPIFLYDSRSSCRRHFVTPISLNCRGNKKVFLSPFRDCIASCMRLPDIWYMSIADQNYA